MEDYTKKENVYYENGSWYFNAKKVDLGHFEVIYSLEGGFADKESAEAAYKQNRQKYEKDIEFVKKQTNIKFTFSEFLDYWFTNYCDDYSFSASYKFKNAWVIYDLIIPGLKKDVLLGQADSNYIADIIKSCKHYCASAEESVYKTLLQVFKAAMMDGYIFRNPMGTIKIKPRPVKKIEIMNKQQIRAFLEVAQRNPHVYLEVLLGLFCGLRSGEVRGLRYDDFDLDNGTVSISRQRCSDAFIRVQNKESCHINGKYDYFGPPKTNSSYRTLMVPDCILDELEKRKSLNLRVLQKFPEFEEQNKDYVSISSQGRITSGGTLTKNVRQFASKAGVRQTVTFHMLRHTFCTILLELNVPLADISKIMGHSSINTTFEIYCGIMEAEEQIRETIAGIEPGNCLPGSKGLAI